MLLSGFAQRLQPVPIARHTRNCRAERSARRHYAKALDLDPNYAYAASQYRNFVRSVLQDAAKAMQHYQRYRSSR